MTLTLSQHGSFLDVIVTQTLTPDDVADLLRAIDAQRLRGPFVILTDTSGMKAAPRPVVMLFVEGMKTRPPLRDIWLANAVVVNSPAARFVLSTLLMIAPMPTQVKAFDKRADAETWLTDVLRQAQLKSARNPAQQENP
ncbi:MAG: hypothetical protein HY904_10265 [Deltaproteobacteria bacterium]|nr:hypothetical protein [Deltaproteobacteria bacterium]